MSDDAEAPSSSTIDDLVVNNAAFVASGFDGARAGYDISSPRPTRATAVVTCMDARIDVFAALGLHLGQAHLIRNAGGLVTDDVLRSLTLSQLRMGTREVLIAHHTDCGLSGLDDAAIAGELEAASGTRPPFAFGGFSDLDESVRTSVFRVRAAAYLPHRDAVRGFVYEVATGRLREVT
jgi:carbonic anhydrase